MMRLWIVLVLFASAVMAKDPVYVVLWFDTEDYVEPTADDAALRIATDLTGLGVRGTFKLVGEKARVLQSRGRTDVIRALSHHAIGYHSNYHSIPPAPAVYLRRLGLLEGAEEFERRERPGVLDIRRIFGVDPICYGQPGSSWAPQTFSALRHLGIPVYLDDGVQVGLDEQPFWYGGLLTIFDLGRYAIRPDLDHEANNRQIYANFKEDAERLSSNGGGVISSYFHPTEFVTTEFWDAVNLRDGAARERSTWERPRKRAPEDAEHCFRTLRTYVETARQIPEVRFVTAQDLLQLYRGPVPPVVEKRVAAAQLKEHITFLKTETGEFSAADLLLSLLDIEPMVVDGPASRGVTSYAGATIPRWLFEKSKADAASYVSAHQRLPSEVFVGSDTLSLPDFAATLAGATASNESISVMHGHIEFEKYFSTDASGAFKWPIHPKNFAAPELLELARLQGWTLKPARFK